MSVPILSFSCTVPVEEHRMPLWVSFTFAKGSNNMPVACILTKRDCKPRIYRQAIFLPWSERCVIKDNSYINTWYFWKITWRQNMTACQSLSFGTVSLTRRSRGLKFSIMFLQSFVLCRLSLSFPNAYTFALSVRPCLLMFQYLCLVVFYFLFYFPAWFPFMALISFTSTLCLSWLSSPV